MNVLVYQVQFHVTSYICDVHIDKKVNWFAYNVCWNMITVSKGDRFSSEYIMLCFSVHKYVFTDIVILWMS